MEDVWFFYKQSKLFGYRMCRTFEQIQSTDEITLNIGLVLNVGLILSIDMILSIGLKVVALLN